MSIAIAQKIIGRVPLWFEAAPYDKEVGGEFTKADGTHFESMNRTTYEGSEFQVKINSDGTFKETVQVPGKYNDENQKMVPSPDWLLISDLSAAWYAKEKMENYWKEVESPEFVEVHTDADDKVLYGVQSDGNFYFGCGVPRQILEVIPGVDPDIQCSVYYGPNPDPNGEGNSSRTVNNTISGMYQVVTSADSHIYFFIPSSVNQFYATINGMEIPFSESLITIDGQEYKKYESVNTYEAATLNIVLA